MCRFKWAIVYSKTACNSKSDKQSIVDIPHVQEAPVQIPNAPASTTSSSQNNEVTNPANSGNYKCDGRTYCSQMTSCEEATFFIKNCPDTKMDGDLNGIPCESQWCNSDSQSTGNAHPEQETPIKLPNSANSSNSGQYKCDGRTYCSQMASCEEATFFINNCPDTKMDGDMDGIPCEMQWCN